MGRDSSPSQYIGIGAACVIAFSFLALSNFNLFNRSLGTVGIVTDVEYGDSSDTLTLQFIDKRNGNHITGTCPTGGLPPWYCGSHSVGERVNVLYDSESPSKVTINEGFWFFWLLPLGLLVYGAPLLPIGIASYMMRRRTMGLTSDAGSLCSKCGTQLPTDAAFCSSCGNELMPASRAHTSWGTVRNMLLIFYVFVSVCFLLNLLMLFA